MNNILISGASGFVGGHLIEALKEGDKDQIIALFHETFPTNLSGIESTRLHWVRKDIVTDELEDVLKGIDLVVHLAGYSSVLENEGACARLHSTNVVTTRRVAEVGRLLG